MWPSIYQHLVQLRMGFLFLMTSTVLEMSPISLTVHILSAQIAQLGGEKRQELFVEVHMVVYLNNLL